MSKDFKEDIHSGNKVDLAMMSLLSDKSRIGIIGSGKAAFIKAKHFLKHGFKVHMIGTENIDNISDKNLTFEKRPYYKDFILDKHIVIICVNSDRLRSEIINDLDKLSKVYVDCTDFKNGNAIISADVSTDSMIVGTNTFYGNPKGSVFVLNKIKKDIKMYDDFIEYTSKIRNAIKLDIRKKSILDFIFTDDFYFFYLKNKGSIILDMFFDNITNKSF